MSDAVKWALLVASILTLLVAVFTLPFAQYIDFGVIGYYTNNITGLIGECIAKARGLINYFFYPETRAVLSGLMFYLFFSKMLKLTIKISAWILHFIFK